MCSSRVGLSHISSCINSVISVIFFDYCFHTYNFFEKIMNSYSAYFRFLLCIMFIFGILYQRYISEVFLFFFFVFGFVGILSL